MSDKFMDVFGVIGGGELIKSLADALTEVGMAVAETGKAGSVTITVSITPNGAGSVLMAGKVAAKTPQRKMLDSLFFVTAGGQFLRDDPAQERLPLHEGYNIHAIKG